MAKYDDGEVLTSLCLWEAWLMMEDTTCTDSASDETRAEVEAVKLAQQTIRDGHGSFVLRQAMIDLTLTIEQLWEATQALSNDDPPCFDFDFVPAQLQAMIMDGRVDQVIQCQYGAPVPDWLVTRGVMPGGVAQAA